MATVVKVVAAFALGFVIGALRLPWEIATELRCRSINKQPINGR